MNASNALKPHLIRPEHLDPHWRWDRAIPSPGHMRSISSAGSISIACAATGWRAPARR